MICLRSQLLLKKSAGAGAVWKALCDWRCQSKNTPVDLRQWFTESTFESLPIRPIDKKSGKVVVSFFKPDESSFAFKLQEDLVVTTICFNASLSDTNFSLEIERTDDRQEKISYPKIFKYLEPFLDAKLYSKQARIEGDFSSVARFINGEKGQIDLPSVYISTNKNNEYAVDPDKLAESLYGIAHIYKEPNHSFSKQLAELTERKAAYNGAIGIYYQKNRIIVMPDRAADINYFNRISRLSVLVPQNRNLTWFGMVSPFLQKTTEEIKTQTVQLAKQLSKMTTTVAVENLVQKVALAKTVGEKKKLEEELSRIKDENLEKEGLIENQKTKLASLAEQCRQRDELIEKLRNEIQALQAENTSLYSEVEKKERELKDYVAAFEPEILEKDAKIDELTHEVERLQSYKGAFDAKNQQDITISVKCPEKSLYPNEIEDFLKGLIFRLAENYEYYNGGKSNDEKGFKRVYHVLKSICENNPEFNFENSHTFQLLKKLGSAKNINRDSDYEEILKSCEFQKDKKNGHPVLCLHGDDRYSVTATCTHRDPHSIPNNIQQAKKCFLSPDFIKECKR